MCRPLLSQPLMFVTLSYGPQFETHDRYNIYVQQEPRMQTTLWTVTVTSACNWHDVDSRVRQTFFAEAGVPCEALETAAYKHFSLRCRQALITDEPVRTRVVLPSGYILCCDATRCEHRDGAVRAHISLLCTGPVFFEDKSKATDDEQVTGHKRSARLTPSPGRRCRSRLAD